MELWTVTAVQALGPNPDPRTHVKAAHERTQMEHKGWCRGQGEQGWRQVDPRALEPASQSGSMRISVSKRQCGEQGRKTPDSVLWPQHMHVHSKHTYTCARAHTQKERERAHKLGYYFLH